MSNVFQMPNRATSWCVGVVGEEVGTCQCGGVMVVIDVRDSSAEAACNECGNTWQVPVKVATNEQEARELDHEARKRLRFSKQEWGNLRALVLREVKNVR